MANDTEKLTINLGVVELAQVDVLVEQGIYANRSDFIRTAIRHNLERHKDSIENALAPIAGKTEFVKVIGITGVTRKSLEKLLEVNEKLNFSVIGMFVVDSNISPQLFQQTVESVHLRGKLVASEEIKALIAQMN